VSRGNPTPERLSKHRSSSLVFNKILLRNDAAKSRRGTGRSNGMGQQRIARGGRVKSRTFVCLAESRK
jgi:hypothetical protein